MKQLFLLLLLLSTINFSTAVAQSEIGENRAFFLGVTGGLLSSEHTGGGVPHDTGYLRTVSGRELGCSAGIVAEQSLNRWLGINGRLQYRSMPGIIYQAPSGEQLLLPDSRPLSIDTVTTTAVQYSNLGVEIQAVAYPIEFLEMGRLLCGIGSSISTPITAARTRYRGGLSYPSRTPLEDAAAASAENGNRATLGSNEAISGLQQFCVEIVGSLGVELKFGNIYLVPQAAYNHALTNLTSRTEDNGWKIHSLAFRVDCRMKL